MSPRVDDQQECRSSIQGEGGVRSAVLRAAGPIANGAGQWIPELERAARGQGEPPFERFLAFVDQTVEVTAVLR